MHSAETTDRIHRDLAVDLADPAVAQPVRNLAAAHVQLLGQLSGREAVDGGVAEIPKPQLDVLAEFVVRDLLRVVPAEGLQ
jgi:hypothetical protein